MQLACSHIFSASWNRLVCCPLARFKQGTLHTAFFYPSPLSPSSSVVTFWIINFIVMLEHKGKAHSTMANAKRDRCLAIEKRITHFYRKVKWTIQTVAALSFCVRAQLVIAGLVSVGCVVNTWWRLSKLLMQFAAVDLTTFNNNNKKLFVVQYDGVVTVAMQSCPSFII